jgi:8-oxo-dGTP pyrophosphatase MutT (NUDIX family)
MTVAMEHKGVRLDTPDLTLRDSDPEGTFVALVSVTGIVDEVGDVIVPGAYAVTLAKRIPKGIFTHDWNRWVAKTIAVEEWLPGDPRLPKTQRNGDPWPVQAGALVVKGQFNLGTSEGRESYENVKFFSEVGECEWSIGYQVPDGAATVKGGIRYIKMLELYEYSPVLFGAAPLSTTLQVKDMLGASAGVATVDGGSADLFGLGEDEELDLVERARRPHLADGPIPGSKILVPLNPNASPKVAGLAVQAADTGRVLMLQRAMVDDDPAAGTWEFPGGHLDGDEEPHQAAFREFAEETGVVLPKGRLNGTWDSPNGVYRGHVYLVASEGDVDIRPDADERAAINPDDPHGDNPEAAAWFHVEDLPAMPSLRREVRDTPWHLFNAVAQRGMCGDCGAPAPGGLCVKGCGIEEKAGGPDRNRGGAENLRKWYVEGEGAVKIRWGTPGDFNRCVRIAGKHMTPDHAKGYCALRHREATGTYPGDRNGHKSYDPAIETGEFAGTMGVKMIEVDLDRERRADVLPGSFEAMRDALRLGLADLLNPIVGDPDDGDLCHDGRAWNTVNIVATFDDHVLAQRIRWTNDVDRVESFQVAYTSDGESVTLGDPMPVRLVTNTTVEPTPYGLGPDAPLADEIAEVAERVAAMLGLTNADDEDDDEPAADEGACQCADDCTDADDCTEGCDCPIDHDTPIIPTDENGDPLPIFADSMLATGEGTPEFGYTSVGVRVPRRVAIKSAAPVETKAGRVLSAANEVRMRAAVENLIAVLAAAGIDLFPKPGVHRDGVPDPMADTTTTSRPDEDMLADEMKGLLAQAADLNAYVLTDGL